MGAALILLLLSAIVAYVVGYGALPMLWLASAKDDDEPEPKPRRKSPKTSRTSGRKLNRVSDPFKVYMSIPCKPEPFPPSQKPLPPEEPPPKPAPKPARPVKPRALRRWLDKHDLGILAGVLSYILFIPIMVVVGLAMIWVCAGISSIGQPHYIQRYLAPRPQQHRAPVHHRVPVHHRRR
jgi:hypothetical protein